MEDATDNGGGEVGVRWWWRDVTAALRPKSETLDDVTEDWDN